MANKTPEIIGGKIPIFDILDPKDGTGDPEVRKHGPYKHDPSLDQGKQYDENGRENSNWSKTYVSQDKKWEITSGVMEDGNSYVTSGAHLTKERAEEIVKAANDKSRKRQPDVQAVNVNYTSGKPASENEHTNAQTAVSAIEAEVHGKHGVVTATHQSGVEADELRKVAAALHIDGVSTTGKLSEEQIEKIQEKLHVGVDGKVGTETLGAIEKIEALQTPNVQRGQQRSV